MGIVIIMVLSLAFFICGIEALSIHPSGPLMCAQLGQSADNGSIYQVHNLTCFLHRFANETIFSEKVESFYTRQCRQGYGRTRKQRVMNCMMVSRLQTARRMSEHQNSMKISGRTIKSKDCDTPPYVDGAMASYDNTTVGSKATYACVKGFQAAVPGAMETICTSSGTWETIQIICTAVKETRWEKIAATSDKATPATHVDSLRQKMSGCEPRMKIKHLTATSTKLVKSFHEGSWNKGVFAHISNYLTKKTWDSFSAAPSRVFEIFVTSGHFTHLEVNFKGKKTITKFTSKLSWLGRHDPCVHTIDQQSTDSLANTLRAGAGGSRETIFHIGSAVTGQRRAGVSTSSRGDAFPTQIYWHTMKRLFKGTMSIGRWFLHGTYHRTSKLNDRNSWCVDTCWNSALGGGSLEAADLNVQHIIAGVRHGHNILVITSNDIVSKATDIYIYEGHVTLVTEQFWTPTDSTQFSASVRTSWIVTSTAGYEKQCIQVPESANVDRKEERNVSSSWFIDSRKWDHALQIDKSGNVISGSRSQLLTFLEEGRNLRVGVTHTSGVYVAMEIDAVELTNSGQVAAEAANRVDLVWTSNRYTFTSTCRLRSSILTTEGTYRQFKYDLGIGGTHNEITDVQTIDWFIEM